MNTGKSLRIVGDPISEFFTISKRGLLIPKPDALQVETVGKKMADTVQKNKKLGLQVVRKVFSVDVEFSYRPAGSTPVVAGGVKLFGPSPLHRLKFKGLIESTVTKDNGFLKKCEKRDKKILAWMQKKIDLVNALPEDNEQLKLLKEIEKYQVKTGGGYDNTEMFGTTKSLLGFLHKSHQDIELDDTLESIIMEEILNFREEFWQQLGVAKGSLRITSYQLVRYLQDSDGMIGWPIYAKARIELTRETALRILMETGVSVEALVGATVTDENDGTRHLAYNVDAVAYALDHMSVRAIDLPAIITTLARIQRHGVKEENGVLVNKDGKDRSVSPNAAFSGAQEAMTFTAFLEACKKAKIPWLPSLQDFDTQVALMKDWYNNVLIPNKCKALAADWSGYDKTVKGFLLASVLYYIVRPLYHKDDQIWVDLAIVSLVFKYHIVSDVAATAADSETWNEIKKTMPCYEYAPGMWIVGTYNGLGSGAKMTHVGGSLYGEVAIHRVIPRLLHWRYHKYGPQAGDDTSLATPEENIDPTSMDKTYQPISEAAAILGLELNPAKQFWYVDKSGEPVNVFLQKDYHFALDIWGIGTGGRYAGAWCFSERDKGLTISEQYLGVVSKWNNGWNCPFIKVYIEDWLTEDDLACAIFHEYGKDSLKFLTSQLGDVTLQDISSRLDLTYNWGMSAKDLQEGNIPVIPIIAEVASRMSPKMSISQALEIMRVSKAQGGSTDESEPDITVDSVIDAEEDSD